MKKFRFNWYFWFFTFLVAIVLVFAPKAIYMLLNNQVTYEGTYFTPFLGTLTAVLFSIVWFIYLISGISILRLIVKNKLTAFTLTDKGIENTAVIINILAFIIVLPVKLIPWEAVEFYDDHIHPYVRLNTKLVKSGIVSKLILKITGFSFCARFVKQSITEEDIAPYMHKFSNKDKLF